MLSSAGKRRYNIKLWKTFTDCFNCLPIAAIGIISSLPINFRIDGLMQSVSNIGLDKSKNKDNEN